MMKRGLLLTVMLLGLTAGAWGAVVHIQAVDHATGYAQIDPSPSVDAPALTQTRLADECWYWYATSGMPPLPDEADDIQRRLDAVGVEATVDAFLVTLCPQLGGEQREVRFTMPVTDIADRAQLATYTELFIAAVAADDAGWSSTQINVHFREQDGSTHVTFSFMLWDALALQEAGFSGAELLAALVDRPLAGPMPTSTPLSPGDPTPCPPHATPERFAVDERDLIAERLRTAEVYTLLITAFGFQNCPNVMTLDSIGWIEVVLKADTADSADALGAAARAVILAAADWPDAWLYLTYTTVPSNEALYRIRVPVRLALAYTQLDLTDEALFFGLQDQEAPHYD